MDEDSDKVLTARIERMLAGMTWRQMLAMQLRYDRDVQLCAVVLLLVLLWGMGTAALWGSWFLELTAHALRIGAAWVAPLALLGIGDVASGCGIWWREHNGGRDGGGR